MAKHYPYGPVVRFLENIMNRTSGNSNESKQESKDKGVLEKVAQTIDPPSREISDDELIDPGSNTPGSKPSDGFRRGTGDAKQER
jgi:hypothetical protein